MRPRSGRRRSRANRNTPGNDAPEERAEEEPGKSDGVLVPGRVEIDDVQPVISYGAYPAKAVVGEIFPVSAAVWRDGHDAVAATLVVRYLGPRYPEVVETRGISAFQSPERPPLSESPRAVPRGSPRESPRVKPLQVRMAEGLEPYVFHAHFTPDRVGLWTYRVDGWGDPVHTWRHGLLAKLNAGQGEAELSNDLEIGAALLERAATGVPRALRDPLLAAIAALRAPGDPVTRTALALVPEVDELLTAYPMRELVTRGEQYGVWVDRPLARFGSWYELFPRSTGGRDADGKPVHGTFKTAASRSPTHRCDGFRHRVLATNSPDRQDTSQRPQQLSHCLARRCRVALGYRQRRGRPRRHSPLLGTIDDFDEFVATARDLGMEVSLDLALQCAPDHPWAREHRKWFTELPDGTIAYAENPPKKYQDIYPLNFDNDPTGLYDEVLRVVLHWVSTASRFFRVDNPHTKPPDFWAWLIG